MCALLFCFAPTFQFMPNAANSDSPPYGRGIPGSPPRLRRAWGRWDIAALACFAPWRETGLAAAKTGEQSENVYENKGPAVKKSRAAGTRNGLDASARFSPRALGQLRSGTVWLKPES